MKDDEQLIVAPQRKNQRRRGMLAETGDGSQESGDGRQETAATTKRDKIKQVAPERYHLLSFAPLRELLI
jgi:hypothetical protein